MSRHDELEHLKRIATPLRVGQHLGEEVLGRPYQIYDWLLYLERLVLEMLNRPGRECMIVSVPPQSGKTTYCGMWLPFWYLGLNPQNQILFISYNEDYASTWGLRVRNLMTLHGPELFGTAVSKNMASISNWRTQGDIGGMLSTGILGGITGNPGHLIIVDDVIKGMEEAGSPTMLRKHLDEWDGSITTRLQENSKVLIVATRWNEFDLSGEVLRRSREEGYGGMPVTHVNLDAIAEPEDPSALEPEELAAWRDGLGRKYGQSLGGQHSLEYFEERRNTPGYEFVFSALYQGRPTARTGGMFPKSNWLYYTRGEEPKFIAKVRVWDLAATSGGGDWTVGCLLGKTVDDRLYVLDVRRFRKDADSVMTEVREVAKTDGLMVPIRIEEERAGAGKSLVALYRQELTGWDIEGCRAEASKEQRAMPWSRFQNAGYAYLPKEMPWVEGFILEHSQMMGDGRKPRHDDQIDTASYAVLELMGSQRVDIVDPEMDLEQLDNASNALDLLAERYGMTMFQEGEDSPSGFMRHLSQIAN